MPPLTVRVKPAPAVSSLPMAPTPQVTPRTRAGLRERLRVSLLSASEPCRRLTEPGRGRLSGDRDPLFFAEGAALLS